MFRLLRVGSSELVVTWDLGRLSSSQDVPGCSEGLPRIDDEGAAQMIPVLAKYEGPRCSRQHEA